MLRRQRFLDGLKVAESAPNFTGFAQKPLVFCSTRFKGVYSNYAHPILFKPLRNSRHGIVRGQTHTDAEDRGRRSPGTDGFQAGSRSNGPDHYFLLPPPGGQSPLSRHGDHAAGLRAANEDAKRSRDYGNRNAGSFGMEARREKYSASLRRYLFR